MTGPGNGQVVIVTGTSGAGKTTTCRAFAERASDCYFIFGFDMLVSTLIPAQYTTYAPKAREYFYFYGDGPDGAGNSKMGFGPLGWRALEAMHEMVAAASRAGQNVVVDHLTFLDPPVLQDCIWRLKDVPVLFVGLRPPREVLNHRLATRQFELPQSMVDASGSAVVDTIAADLQASTSWFYEATYANDCYDILIDSAALTPDQVCEQIEERLSQGPGTAFKTLRERYPHK